MKTCLVKKLNSAVDDSNLVPIGGIRFSVHAAEPGTENIVNSFTIINPEKDVTIKVFGEGYVSLTNDFSQRLKIVNIPAQNIGAAVFFSDGNYNGLIENKYGLESIYGTSASKGGDDKYLRLSFEAEDWAYSVNLESWFSLTSAPLVTGNIQNMFKGITKIKVLRITRTRLYGDISILRGMTQLESLHIYGESENDKADIYGDIAALSAATSLKVLYIPFTKISGDLSSILSSAPTLETLQLYASNVSDNNKVLPNFTSLNSLSLSSLTDYALTDFSRMTQLPFIVNAGVITSGSVEDYVSQRIAASGSDSGTIRLEGPMPGVTLGSTALARIGGLRKFIHWEGTNKIWINCAAVSAAESTSTIVMCKGCTQEQISAWQNEGKTVMTCD